MNNLQTSSPKSGTLWLYRILEHILDANDIEKNSYIRQHSAYLAGEGWPFHFAGRADVDFLFIEPEGYQARFAGQNYDIDDIDDYMRRTRHIRSHSPFCSRCAEFFPKVDKIVYIIRDPRDRLISYANYIFLPERIAILPDALRGHRNKESYLAGEFAHEMNLWRRDVDAYLRHRAQFDIHIMFFERLLYAFDQEIDALLAYLGLSLSPQARAVLESDVAFAAMKENFKGHLREGRAGGWRSVLNERQKRQAVQIAGPLLSSLHYPLDDSQPYDAAHLPSVSGDRRTDRFRALLRLLTYFLRR